MRSTAKTYIIQNKNNPHKEDIITDFRACNLGHLKNIVTDLFNDRKSAIVRKLKTNNFNDLIIRRK